MQKKLLPILALLLMTAVGTRAATIDLSTVSGNVTAQNGDVLTGTLKSPDVYKVSIADGATVTLNNVTIYGFSCPPGSPSELIDLGDWPGLFCEGDATIILVGDNTVTGGQQSNPGIYVKANKTLTIQGTGSLTAGPSDTMYSYSGAISGYDSNIIIKSGTITAYDSDMGSNLAIVGGGNVTIEGGTIDVSAGHGNVGIGGNGNISISGGNISVTTMTSSSLPGIGCDGNITITDGTINSSIGICNGGGSINISGGTITAQSSDYCAGIGSMRERSCGNINITGGTIYAEGRSGGAGIGSGLNGSCGFISITGGIIEARADGYSPNSIGAGSGGICGAVTIGGVVYWDGTAYQNDGDDPSTGIVQISYIYEGIAANTDGNGNYWATYYDNNNNFRADANTTVYQAAVSGDKIVLTEVTDRIIPYNDAVILKSSASIIGLTSVTKSAIDHLTGNQLLGMSATTAAPTDAYCLSLGNKGIGFYKYTGNIPAHRAYLVISSSGARGFLGFDNDNTTGIDVIENNNDDVLFDLSGRRLTGQPQKGIYVKNGKKIIIK